MYQSLYKGTNYFKIYVILKKPLLFMHWYCLLFFLQEDECSVHFEWYNNATCDILKVNKENKLKLSGGSIAAISTVIIFLLISIVVFIFYGVRKNIFRKCLQRDKSVIRVYYEKVKTKLYILKNNY